ncbi:MAG: DUF3857 domain-containing protein [Candidatus Cyclobacteriaceae bacterium M3_2C_046]
MQVKESNRKLGFTILGLFLTFLVQAQIGPVKLYDWQADRSRIEITEEEKQEAALILKQVQAYEYIYQEDHPDLILYALVHKIIRVNSDDAIQNFNKIYIPTDEVEEIVDIKARSISPSGEVVELDKNNIKELKDEEDESSYKIFAIEGVELGSEIEYFYISKDYVSYFGRDFFQSVIPVKEAYFELISPENLKFSVKGYNGFPKCSEKIEDGKRILTASMNNIPGFKQEAFSFYNSNRMRVEFKLSYNTIRGKNKLLTWSDAAQRIHSNIYNIDKKEKRAVKKLIRSIKLSSVKNPEDKIRTIENHLKTTCFIQEGYAEDYYNIKSILDQNYGNKTGVVRLYSAVFKQAGIEHELVMTSDRSDVKFDKDFESWNYLVNYAFYFPQVDNYLSPERIDYRYGMIPFYMTHNYGLFVRTVPMGDFETGIGEVRFIPANDYSQNYDDMDISIAFAEDMEKTDINITRKMGGYSGAYIQPFYSFLQEDKRRTIIEGLVRMSAEDAKFNQLEIKNGEINVSPLRNPFVINASIESSSLIEKAGNKFLFKFGKIIGPQSELYQEEKRQNDIENDFNRSYTREIKFKVPENYRVKNLEDIRMDVFFKKDDNRIFNFTSSYEQSGDEVTVRVNEYYKEIYCDNTYFEEFRKVINAAADFNKITLVLEKK